MSRSTSPKQRLKVTVSAAPKLNRVLKRLAQAYAACTDKEALAVPYIVTCAAALEAKLNDALVQHAASTWQEGSQPIQQAFLSMSFRGKLEATAVLLTGEKFRLNPDDEYVKRLHSLISYRNLLVHPKPTAHEVSTVAVTHPIYGVEFEVPGPEYDDLVADLTFGAKNHYKPQEYHEALDKLDKWFFKRLPDRVSKVRLLIPRGEA
ncbi:MAG: hypothetical protein F9K13_03410 [Candidatus Methylomirabilis oxygeniifera]|uniref:Uncharacterized protein n=1 Tax=Methylomirabilis oxygeniifera TaxID=671143 RepID=D5MFM5_METO1|nr:MAG: hypothetical protein F9K13_03410 [Candidatus Methylomirabilis oxyfera]CBE68556.1 protein of unknown function [Candidatus Methylomirabilis oxyfera]